MSRHSALASARAHDRARAAALSPAERVHEAGDLYRQLASTLTAEQLAQDDALRLREKRFLLQALKRLRS